jgi:hypothetical protein
MADDIHITGSDVEWALEKTQTQILAALSKIHKLEDTQAKEAKKVTEEVKRKGFLGAQGKKAFGDLTNGLKASANQAKKHADGQKTLISTTKDLNKEFKESSKTFKGAMVGMGLIGGILGQLYGQFTSTIKVFAELTDIGVSTTMSYKGLSKSLAEIGMSLDQFQAIAQRYSTVIGKMGMAQFTEIVTGVGKGFHKFGLTMAEGAEWAAEYLQQQRLLGNFSIYNQRGMNEAVRSNIERLTAYSKVLNVSRSELQEAQTRAAQDSMVQSRLMTMSADQAQKANKAYLDVVARLESFGATGLANKFIEMFGFNDPEMSAAYEELAGTSASAILDQMKDLHRMATEGIMPKDADIEKLGKQAVQFIQDQGYTIQEAMRGGNQGIQEIARLAMGYREYAALTPEQKRLRGLEQTRAQRMVELTAELNTNLDRLKGSFLYLSNTVLEKLIKLLGGESTEGTMAGGVKAIADAADRAADFLMEVAEGKWDWKGALANLGTALWDGIKGGFETFMQMIADQITDAIDRLVSAVKNFSLFGNNDPAVPQFGEKRREALMAHATRTRHENAIRDATKARDEAVARLGLYNEQGVTAAMQAAGPEAYQNSGIPALIETIQQQNRILEESRKELKKIQETAEAGNG